MKYNSSDPYGLRTHNKRIGNPEMKYHTPRYYAIRDNVRMIVRLFFFMIEVVIVCVATYYVIGILAAVAGG